MSSFFRRVFATTALAGLISTPAFAQNPYSQMPAIGTAPPVTTPITPPPLFTPASGSEATSGVKDLTPSVLPGLFDPLHSEGHASAGESHGAAGAHSSGGHAAGGHEAGHEEGGGLFGSVEYLLMRARRGAFDFALVDSTKDLVPNGKLESLNYELRSGVRAGLGYRFQDTAWSVGFAYTFLRTGNDRTVESPPATAPGTSNGGLVYATLTRPGVIDNVDFAQASASLEYNLFDIEVSRKFHVDDRFDVRLFGGARFATIRQDFDVLYDRRDANLARVMTKSNFDGFGPLMGADGTLKIRGGFHLYGRTSAALLSGRITNPYRETQNDGQTLLADVNYRTRRVIPVLGAAIAGGWQGHNVSVRVGYEMTHWTNLIDTPRFTNDLSEGKLTTRTGDLSLEGLFIQLAVAY